MASTSVETEQQASIVELASADVSDRFGELLRERRERAKLTLSSLARKAGLTRGTIRNIEAGITTPSPNTVRRLASVSALRLQPADLAGAHESEEISDSWFAPQYNPLMMTREMVSALNGPGGQLDQTYLYLDPQSASDWDTLCNSERYTTAFRARLPVAKVAERIVRESRGAGLDVDALGSGDGKTETLLVQHMADLLPSPPDLRLYLLDISHTLLSSAYRYASDALAQRRVAVFPLHGNFHDIGRLPTLYYHPAGVRRIRLFALVGYTIANLMDERRFFRDLAECAKPDDLALLDVQLVRAPVDEPAELRRLEMEPGQRALPSYADFLSGPLHRHCRGAKRIQLRIELELHCAVPGSYEVEFFADVQMEEGPPKRFLVWRVRRYDPTKLGEYLAGLGWEPIHTWRYGPGSEKLAAVMLLRRRG